MILENAATRKVCPFRMVLATAIFMVLTNAIAETVLHRQRRHYVMPHLFMKFSTAAEVEHLALSDAITRGGPHWQMISSRMNLEDAVCNVSRRHTDHG